MKLIHSSKFPETFGLLSRPGRHQIYQWQKLGFPKGLSTPRGYYVLADVEAWFAKQAAIASAKSVKAKGGAK